jgi:endonuclease YncB( thermonuclease family)
MSLLGLLSPQPASLSHSPPARPSLANSPSRRKAKVAEVKDGETLALTDGTVVRLVSAKSTAPIAARDDRP